MTAVTKFEDLPAWQEARTFAKDFGMRDKIQRAAVSVMTNITEGFDCESSAEFACFLGIARRSAVEVQSLLYAALDVEYIDRDVFNSHYEQAKKCKALIGGLKHSDLKDPRRNNIRLMPKTWNLTPET